MADGVKFVRIRGRIVPIKQKSYMGTKTTERGIIKRAASGAATWGKIGAGVGAVFGVTSGLASGLGGLGSAGVGALYAGSAAINLGALGAVGGALFGKRKVRMKVRKTKYSSV